MNGVSQQFLQQALTTFVQQNGRPPSTQAEWINVRALAEQHAFQVAASQRLAPPQHHGALLGPMQPQAMPWGNFPFPTGDVTVPPAGWEQQPQRPVEQYRKDEPTIRWGDTVTIEVPQVVGTPTSKASGYVLDCQLWRPATCIVRLSATTDAISALDPQWLCTWSLTIGVGSSSQVKQRQVQLAPESDPTVDTDIVLTWPLQLLRVQATVQVGSGGSTVAVHATAHVAPLTNFEGMVR
jgi:hypothetical protein